MITVILILSLFNALFNLIQFIIYKDIIVTGLLKIFMKGVKK